jgi:hypothetical protein
LIRALYRETKLELAGTMMSEFPRKKSVHAGLRHVWDGYVNWGVNSPEQRRVLAEWLVFWDAFERVDRSRKRALYRNAEDDSRCH